MEYKDYYKILGVPKTASAKEIKSAYRKLARRYHPDVNKGEAGAEARFKEINEANEVLGDEEKRRKYDQLGANWQAYEQWQRAGGQGSGVPFDLSDLFGARGGGARSGRAATADDLNDLFGGSHSEFFQAFFGGLGGQAPPRPRRTAMAPRAGESIEQEVELSLEEAFHGTTRLLHLLNPDETTRRIEARLPAGVADGQGVTLAGLGAPGLFGGPAGDLIIRVRLRPHERFSRDGDDLSLKLPVPLTTCMLGGEVSVPTLAGARLLRIPPETADGRRIRLRGQGMPRRRRAGQEGEPERGDLYVEVHVQLPRDLTARQRELFEELARLEEAGETSAAG